MGGRTHSTIAAYSSGVPTLVMGYSVKARGIARDLFGTEEGYVLPVQSLADPEEIARAFLQLVNMENTILARLKADIPKIKKLAHRPAYIELFVKVDSNGK